MADTFYGLLTLHVRVVERDKPSRFCNNHRSRPGASVKRSHEFSALKHFVLWRRAHPSARNFLHRAQLVSTLRGRLNADGASLIGIGKTTTVSRFFAISRISSRPKSCAQCIRDKVQRSLHSPASVSRWHVATIQKRNSMQRAFFSLMLVSPMTGCAGLMVAAMGGGEVPIVPASEAPKPLGEGTGWFCRTTSLGDRTSSDCVRNLETCRDDAKNDRSSTTCTRQEIATCKYAWMGGGKEGRHDCYQGKEDCKADPRGTLGYKGDKTSACADYR
jgi:hypothetical protein